MKQINCTLSGRRTDTPVLRADDGTIAATVVEGPTRAIFEMADHVMGGATILYGGQEVRVLLPVSGSQEGPVLDYGPAAKALSVQRAQFVNGGEAWTWRGCSDFRLPARFMARENVRAVLDDRKAVGATLLRCFAMKANNIGWELRPGGDEYFLEVGGFFEILGVAGFACEWTVFADTRAVLADPVAQQDFWHQTIDVARDYPHVVLELVNEAGHPTQALNADRFERPAGVLASHGSGGTDEDVVRPLWDYATYHARRVAYGGDGRGATNYSPYAFQELCPKPCPFIPDEGAKPQDYRFNVEYARLMGLHASCGAGGTFHSDDGIQSVVFSPETRACAVAFFEALS